MNLRGQIVNAIDLRHCFGNLDSEIDNAIGVRVAISTRYSPTKLVM